MCKSGINYSDSLSNIIYNITNQLLTPVSMVYTNRVNTCINGLYEPC